MNENNYFVCNNCNKRHNSTSKLKDQMICPDCGGDLITNLSDNQNPQDVTPDKVEDSENKFFNEIRLLQIRFRSLKALLGRTIIIFCFFLFILIFYSDRSMNELFTRRTDLLIMLIIHICLALSAIIGISLRAKWGRIASVIYSLWLIIRPSVFGISLIVGIWNLVACIRLWNIFNGTKYTQEEVNDIYKKLSSEKKG